MHLAVGGNISKHNPYLKIYLLYIRRLIIALIIYKHSLSITVCGIVFTQSINFSTAALISSLQLKKTLFITESLS